MTHLHCFRVFCEQALPESLRGELFAHYDKYDLEAAPAGAQNGCHASASPLEALHERTLWSTVTSSTPGIPTKWTPLRDRLQAAGAGSDATVAKLCNNVTFAQDGDVPVFDVVEHTNTDVCATLLIERVKAE